METAQANVKMQLNKGQVERFTVWICMEIKTLVNFEL